MDYTSAIIGYLKRLKGVSIYNSTGFTLIELLLVIIILGILLVGATMLFNPLAQMQKAHNATREQDLNQIKNALDTYYNDTGCYPSSVNFGGKWSSGTVVYMEKVPEDPDCSAQNRTNCYNYQTDGSSCPQWNILYATMHQPIATSIGTCSLSALQSCLPFGGLSSYNYCTISGKLDCSYLSKNPIPTPPLPGGSGGSGGGSTPIATPTSICSGPLSACSNKGCDVETASQCAGCGGAMQCYTNNDCGGVKCN